MEVEKDSGKIPICHQERFSQNSDGWTIVKVRDALKKLLRRRHWSIQGGVYQLISRKM